MRRAVSIGLAAVLTVGVVYATAVARGDTDRLLAHERFLADRFGTGELGLNGPTP